MLPDMRHVPHHWPHVKRNWFVVSAGLILLFGGLFLLWAASLRIPDLTAFEERRVESSTKLYDRTGNVLLYDVYENVKRTAITREEMGEAIQQATVAIEDKGFYQHGGIRLRSIARAVLVNLGLWEGYAGQGGSTITQQVIKNAILTQDKKISRKIKEWILAIKLEQEMSKDDILELYLNESPYGGEMYGIAEAANYYFGKKPIELTLAEAAYLAALPQAPTRYSPYGKNRALLDSRKAMVLSNMHELGFITREEYEKAQAEVVAFIPHTEGRAKALHFVMYVREYLEETYGQEILFSGLKVITTLDYNLQKKAEEVVLKYAKENEKNFNAENASLVAIDPKTGQILVMVGSRDYFDKEIDGNFNVATAHRQPGSAFKPIVYATAFMKGLTPETVVFDLPTEFQTTCTPDGKPRTGDACYMPENYDLKYRGPVTLREALAQSLNVPAIKVLYLAGIDDSLRTARAMGIKSLKDKDQYGLTLVLGGGEVSLLDLTSAYGVLANKGVRNPHQPILRIEDSKGQILEEWRVRDEQVIPKEVALDVTDILADNAARAPAFGERSALTISGREVAVKTGTTNDYRDAWVIGYTPSLAVGAWSGNNDNTPMEKRVAGFIVAPLWNAFMQEALKEYPVERFERPDKEVDLTLKPVLRGIWWGGEHYLIDKISGKLATPNTPREALDELVIRNPHSILYWIDKRDPLGPPPLNPQGDPQFEHWEHPIREWLARQPYIPGVTRESVPSVYDDVHLDGASSVTIIEPTSSSVFRAGDTVRVAVTSQGRFPITKINFFLNNSFIGTSIGTAPFLFIIDDGAIIGAMNELKVVATDSAYNSTQSSVSFLVTGAPSI